MMLFRRHVALVLGWVLLALLVIWKLPPQPQPQHQHQHQNRPEHEHHHPEEKGPLCSPNGQLCLIKKDVLSPLLFEMEFHGVNFGSLQLELLAVSGWDIKNQKLISANETWTPLYGTRNSYRNEYRGVILSLRGRDSPVELRVEVRVHDAALAVQARLPDGARRHLSRMKLHTSYCFRQGGHMWVQNRGESDFFAVPLGQAASVFKNKKAQPRAFLPVTITIPGLHMSLNSAGYLNTSLIWGPAPSNCTTGFSTIADVGGDSKSTHAVSLPWAVLIMARSLGDLVQQTHILDSLAPPANLPGLHEWVRPGKVYRDIELSTATSKEIIRYAKDHNIQYLLLDAGWYGGEYNRSSYPLHPSTMPKLAPFNLTEVLAYGKANGIGVFLYVNDIALRQWWPKILQAFVSWGVTGIKFGFVNAQGSQFNRILDYVKDCLEHRLLVNIHDDFRPSGLSRTFPNLLSQEGIRGNEHFPGSRHNCLLPFIRLVPGPGDYTFVYRTTADRPCLTEERVDYCVQSNSIAHQTALPIVMYNPLQHLFWYQRIGGLLAQDMETTPEIEVWTELPATWNQSILLDGQMGQRAIFARQAPNGVWFVGGIFSEACSISIPLSFLPSDRQYRLRAYQDYSRDFVDKTQLEIEAPYTFEASIIKGGGIVLIVDQVDVVDL